MTMEEDNKRIEQLENDIADLNRRMKLDTKDLPLEDAADFQYHDEVCTDYLGQIHSIRNQIDGLKTAK